MPARHAEMPPKPALAPAEKAAAAPRLTPAPTPTASSPPAEKRRLAAPLADAIARAARGSPSELATPDGPPVGPFDVGTVTGSGVRSPSTVALGFFALSKTTSWLESVRLMLERSGTPLAPK